jgi:hypothetical protein
MTPGEPAIIDADETHIRVRGYDITDLMRQAGFVRRSSFCIEAACPTPGEKRCSTL